MAHAEDEQNLSAPGDDQDPQQCASEQAQDAEPNGAEDAKPASVHHSVWSFSCEQPRHAVVGTGTGWASAFFPPTPLQPGQTSVIPGSGEKGAPVEAVISTLEHKIALLQQDLAHSWGHLNDWKKRLCYEQSEVGLRAQDLDNKEKLLSELARELEERDQVAQQREHDLARLDADLEARLRDLGHREIDRHQLDDGSKVRYDQLKEWGEELARREAEIRCFAQQYEGQRAELERLAGAAERDRLIAEQDRRAAEQDRRIAERLEAERAQHAEELARREQDLQRSQAEVEEQRLRLHDAHQGQQQQERDLAQRKERLEQCARELEGRYREVCENEKLIKKRGESLGRFQSFLHDAVQACGTDTPSAAAEHSTAGAGPQSGGRALLEPREPRAGVQDAVKKLQREAQVMLSELGAAAGDAADCPPGKHAQDHQVQKADSLNTHLFRRIKHNRLQRPE